MKTKWVDCIANSSSFRKANPFKIVNNTKVPLASIKRPNRVLIAILFTMVVHMLAHRTRSESKELTTILLFG